MASLSLSLSDYQQFCCMRSLLVFNKILNHAEESKDSFGVNLRTDQNLKKKMFCFILCGFLAGFAGMIQTFRLEAPLPTQGYLLELESIAAAVIGGVSLFGGIGTVFGAMLGAILIRFLESGIIMARIDAEWFRAGLGSLIIISVVVNTYISRRATTLGQNKSKE